MLQFDTRSQAHTSDPEDVNTSIDGANRFYLFFFDIFMLSLRAQDCSFVVIVTHHWFQYLVCITVVLQYSCVTLLSDVIFGAPFTTLQKGATCGE